MATIELPKDAEGREIPLDTAVLYNKDGTEFYTDRATYMRLIEDWWFFGHFGSHTDTHRVAAADLYLTPPDSWEKLEDDLGRCIEEDSLCPYNPSEECSTCVLARDSQCNCDSFALKDILDRIRKLRNESL